jgi:hypothetical protein
MPGGFDGPLVLAGADEGVPGAIGGLGGEGVVGELGGEARVELAGLGVLLLLGSDGGGGGERVGRALVLRMVPDEAEEFRDGTVGLPQLAIAPGEAVAGARGEVVAGRFLQEEGEVPCRLGIALGLGERFGEADVGAGGEVVVPGGLQERGELPDRLVGFAGRLEALRQAEASGACDLALRGPLGQGGELLDGLGVLPGGVERLAQSQPGARRQVVLGRLLEEGRELLGGLVVLLGGEEGLGEAQAGARHETVAGRLLEEGRELLGGLVVLPVLVERLAQHNASVGHAVVARHPLDEGAEPLDAFVALPGRRAGPAEARRHVAGVQQNLQRLGAPRPGLWAALHAEEREAPVVVGRREGGVGLGGRCELPEGLLVLLEVQQRAAPGRVALGALRVDLHRARALPGRPRVVAVPAELRGPDLQEAPQRPRVGHRPEALLADLAIAARPDVPEQE